MNSKEVERADCIRLAEIIGLTNYVLDDRPDLQFRQHGKVIGVEHTRAFVEDSMLASGRQLLPQEKHHWEILDRARTLFETKSKLYLWVAVTFANPSDYRRSDIVETAELLTTCVRDGIEKNRPEPREAQNIDVSYLRYKGLPYPKDIVLVRYSIEEDPKMAGWGPSYGYGVPTFTSSEVQAAISSKDSKLAGYKSCNETWLLIVTDYGMPSSHFTIPENLAEHRYKTRYSRVFLLLRVNDKLVELQTQS